MLEEHVKKAYMWRILEENRDPVPSVTIMTIHHAYDLLKNRLGVKQTDFQEVYENAERALELEPDEGLLFPAVISAGWESTLWILWVCCTSSYLTSPSLQQQQHPSRNNQIIYISQWIRKMEIKYPVHTDPPRPFSGDNQERETLMEILESAELAKHDVFEVGDRISWASYVVEEESFKNPRVWWGEGGHEAGCVEVEERQLVLF